jgi:hypothetical protein
MRDAMHVIKFGKSIMPLILTFIPNIRYYIVPFNSIYKATKVLIALTPVTDYGQTEKGFNDVCSIPYHVY